MAYKKPIILTQRYCSINIGPTNVGRYKSKTYKRRTSTNVGLVQMSDSTHIRPVQTPDQYKRRTKENIFIWI